MSHGSPIPEQVNQPFNPTPLPITEAGPPTPPPQLGDIITQYPDGTALIFSGYDAQGFPEYTLRNLSPPTGSAGGAPPTVFGEPYVMTLNGQDVLVQDTSQGPQVISSSFGGAAADSFFSPTQTPIGQQPVFDEFGNVVDFIADPTFEGSRDFFGDLPEGFVGIPDASGNFVDFRSDPTFQRPISAAEQQDLDRLDAQLEQRIANDAANLAQDRAELASLERRAAAADATTRASIAAQIEATKASIANTQARIASNERIANMQDATSRYVAHLSADVATRGQDVTLRGQDIGFTTDIRGQDVTREGNITQAYLDFLNLGARQDPFRSADILIGGSGGRPTPLSESSDAFRSFLQSRVASLPDFMQTPALPPRPGVPASVTKAAGVLTGGNTTLRAARGVRVLQPDEIRERDGRTLTIRVGEGGGDEVLRLNPTRRGTLELEEIIPTNALEGRGFAQTGGRLPGRTTASAHRGYRRTDARAAHGILTNGIEGGGRPTPTRTSSAPPASVINSPVFRNILARGGRAEDPDSIVNSPIFRNMLLRGATAEEPAAPDTSVDFGGFDPLSNPDAQPTQEDPTLKFIWNGERWQLVPADTSELGGRTGSAGELEGRAFPRFDTPPEGAAGDALGLPPRDGIPPALDFSGTPAQQTVAEILADIIAGRAGPQYDLDLESLYGQDIGNPQDFAASFYGLDPTVRSLLTSAFDVRGVPPADFLSRLNAFRPRGIPAGGVIGYR